MRLNPRSMAPDGTDVIWLGQRGQVPSWNHTMTFPGGPANASFDFNGPAGDLPYLHGGRIIHAMGGGAIMFAGRLDAPKPGNPWQCSVTGLAAMAKDYTVGTGWTNLDDLVDDCISRGLPWSRPASLNSPNKEPDPSDTLDTVLGQLVSEGSYMWRLTVDGTISTVDGPDIEPSWLLRVRDLPAQTLDGYTNVIRYEYKTDPSTTVYDIIDVGSTRLGLEGRLESTLDLTSVGILTGPAADAIAAKILALRSQIRWSDKFVVNKSNLRNMGGTPSDPIAIQAGQMIQVAAMRPLDPFTERFTIIAGQVDYSTDGTVAITPYYSTVDDLVTVTSEMGLPA